MDTAAFRSARRSRSQRDGRLSSHRWRTREPRRQTRRTQRAISRTAFLPQLLPILQPLPDLALEAALRRIVEFLAAQRLREVILAREGLRRIVVVFVACAVVFLFHQLGWR